LGREGNLSVSKLHDLAVDCADRYAKVVRVDFSQFGNVVCALASVDLLDQIENLLNVKLKRVPIGNDHVSIDTVSDQGVSTYFRCLKSWVVRLNTVLFQQVSNSILIVLI
jgi:hypothetical protein